MEDITEAEWRRLSRYEVQPDGCWRWQGSLNHAGYGRIKLRDRWQAIHRAVYEAHRGPIPDGLELDHLCRNRACVNPDHLEPVARQENIRRAHGSMMKASRRKAVARWAQIKARLADMEREEKWDL